MLAVVFAVTGTVLQLIADVLRERTVLSMHAENAP